MTSMNISDIVIPTSCVQAGDSIKHFFELCIKENTPALPFRDKEGNITAFVSLKEVMGKDCLPNYLVELAGILNNDMNCVSKATDKIIRLFQKTVDEYIEEPILFIASDAILIRVVALMEKYDTDFLFVADDEKNCSSHYKGIVSRLAVAGKMLKIASASTNSSLSSQE